MTHQPDTQLLRRRGVWRQRLTWVVLLLVLGCVAMGFAGAAQAPDRVETMRDELAKHETRITVLENSMGEIVWLGRAVVVGVIGQLFLMIRTDRRRREIDPVQVAAWLRRSPGGDE